MVQTLTACMSLLMMANSTIGLVRRC